MAVIKINRSNARVAEAQVPNLSALRLDGNLAINYGIAIASVGKVVQDAKAKTQKTQDINDVRALTMEANKAILKASDNYKNSSNVADVDNFYNDINFNKFKPLLKDSNTNVQKLFAAELYKTTNSTGMKLYASILNKHGQVTQQGIRDDLFQLNILESHNDPLTRKKAQDQKDLIYNNPDTLNVFGEVELNKIMQDGIIETKMMQYSNRIKNNPMDVLKLGEKNIASDVANETLARSIIQDAEVTLISKAIQEDTINELRIKADTEQKLNNFAYVIGKMNNGDTTISLDDINDLYKKDQLNSSQRDALYNLFANPTKLSEKNIVDMIEGSMLIAESVEEIDELRKQILSSPEYVASLGLTKFSEYNALFEKYQKNLPAFTEYTNNMKLLEADLGKITSGAMFSVAQAMGLSAGNPAIKANEKLRTNATGHYKTLVLDGMSPADAYIETTKRFLRGNNIPGVKDFTTISSITLSKPTEEETKSPSTYVINRTKELTELYRGGAIDINTFSSDLASIDSIDNLIKLRGELGIDDVFGFENINEGQATPKIIPK